MHNDIYVVINYCARFARALIGGSHAPRMTPSSPPRITQSNGKAPRQAAAVHVLLHESTRSDAVHMKTKLIIAVNEETSTCKEAAEVVPRVRTRPGRGSRAS